MTTTESDTTTGTGTVFIIDDLSDLQPPFNWAAYGLTPELVEWEYQHDLWRDRGWARGSEIMMLLPAQQMASASGIPVLVVTHN